MNRLAIVFSFVLPAIIGTTSTRAEERLNVVVMDPLAAPLACDCVGGYAQRDYGVLAKFVEKRIGRDIKVYFSDNLTKVAADIAKKKNGGKVDLIIGKRSLVEFDAAKCKLTVEPLAMLSGTDGKTTFTGLFVVPNKDKAKSLADLKGYRVLFGPEDSDEKHSAAMAALREAGIPVAEKPEIRFGCSESALEVIENKSKKPAVAVISSYAMALLEGCGTVDKGSLRLIGETKPLPFITVAATQSVDLQTRKKILDALLAVGENARLLKKMESKDGFVAISEGGDAKAKPAKISAAVQWPQWRGVRRDGIVERLPEKLPEKPKVLWKTALTGNGLSGVVVDQGRVIVADRDVTDCDDIFRCLDADSGEELWKLQYSAPGDMDYGCSARAAPLIHEGKVFLLGAFGDFNCVDIKTGKVLWKKNILREFGAKLVEWGMCASPLIVDGKLILNPGGKEASLVALNPDDGKVVWKTPGKRAAYSAFIVGTFGEVRQIVGYDSVSVGGWDPATGRRLWTLSPPEEGDFNVPTPIDLGGKLLLSTERNGTRVYAFDDEGKIVSKPMAVHEELAPDTSSSVLIDGKLFGCWLKMFCLDAENGLKEVWSAEDDVFDDYVCIFGSPDRIMVLGVEGELLLIGIDGGKYDLISRVEIVGGQSEVLSHPALVGNLLYVRDSDSIRCIELN